MIFLFTLITVLKWLRPAARKPVWDVGVPGGLAAPDLTDRIAS